MISHNMNLKNKHQYLHKRLWKISWAITWIGFILWFLNLPRWTSYEIRKISCFSYASRTLDPEQWLSIIYMKYPFTLGEVMRSENKTSHLQNTNVRMTFPDSCVYIEHKPKLIPPVGVIMPNTNWNINYEWLTKKGMDNWKRANGIDSKNLSVLQKDKFAYALNCHEWIHSNSTLSDGQEMQNYLSYVKEFGKDAPIGYFDSTGMLVKYNKSKIDANLDFTSPDHKIKIKGFRDQYKELITQICFILQTCPVNIFELDLIDPYNIILYTELGTVMIGSDLSKLIKQLLTLDSLRKVNLSSNNSGQFIIDLRDPFFPIVVG